MREAYDACTAANIPQDAAIVLGYIDGKCKWSQADWDRFPNAVKGRISSLGTNDGEILDVEPQNRNAKQAVDWVRLRRAARIDPTVYTAEWAGAGTMYGDGYSKADCIREFDAAGEPQPHYWLAPLQRRRLLDGTLEAPYVPDGCVAAQYDYPGPFDRSVVLDYWPGIDPVPQPKKMVKMFIIQCEDKSQWLHTGGVRHISAEESTIAIAAGVPVVPGKLSDVLTFPKASEAPLLVRDPATGAVYSPTPRWRHIGGKEYNMLLAENAEVLAIDTATVIELIG